MREGAHSIDGKSSRRPAPPPPPTARISNEPAEYCWEASQPVVVVVVAVAVAPPLGQCWDGGAGVVGLILHETALGFVVSSAMLLMAAAHPSHPHLHPAQHPVIATEVSMQSPVSVRKWSGGGGVHPLPPRHPLHHSPADNFVSESPTGFPRELVYGGGRREMSFEEIIK